MPRAIIINIDYNEVYCMLFCEQVKSARKQLKMSQTVFAQELNVSFASLNRWENGRTEPQPAIKDVFYNYCKNHNVKVMEEK